MPRFIICLLLLLAHLGWTGMAMAATPSDSVYLEDLTWTELRHQIQQGKTTVLMPIGGTEQNGPRMALGKHTARVRFLAGSIAQQLGNTLVAPTLPFVPEGSISPATGHMKFPGTLTLPEATFHTALISLAESLKHAGFQRIVLLADHGGNQKALVRVADELNHQWAATPVRVLALTEYYRAAQTDYAKWLAAQGYSLADIGEHAGLADTALSMAIDEQSVRPGNAPTLLAPGEADGIRGNPKAATAQLGRWAVNHIVEVSVTSIRAFQARVR